MPLQLTPRFPNKIEERYAKKIEATYKRSDLDFPGYAKIRHLVRVSEPWTVENGLITPTLKLKRNKIEERYAKEIEAMYKRTDVCGSS